MVPMDLLRQISYVTSLLGDDETTRRDWVSMGEGGHFRLLLPLLEVFEGRLKEAWVSTGSESTTCCRRRSRTELLVVVVVVRW